MGGLLGGGSKKAKRNATQVSNQQLDYNKQTAGLEADLNRYNETNPYANVQWTKDPVTGQWSVAQTATPQLQEAINSSLDSQTAGNRAVQAGAGRIAGTVGTAFDTSGLPGYGATPQADAALRFTPQSTVPTAGPVQTGLGNTGNPFAAVFGAGSVPDPMNVTPGQYASALGETGPIQRNVAAAGPINQNIDLQTGLGDAGPIQRGLDYSSAPGLYGSGDVSADYNSAVGTAFGAQKANIDEAYGREREQLIQRLADQGIPMDSEAARFQIAQIDKNRDAAYIQAQAAAANTGLNTQGTLSDISRANRGQMVGEATTQGGFGNQSQAQQFEQMLRSGAFGNDAMLAAAQYGLGAQGQQYGQNANDMQQANAAQAQAFSEALGRGQFGNDATGRAFADQLAASGQNYGQAANTQQTRYGQQSDAQQRAFEQALGRGEFYNAGIGQQYGQDLTTQTTQFGQNMGRAGMYNQALQQDFGNSLASSQQQNALRSQAFDESATARNIPIAEVTSMMNAQQPTPQLPSVQTPPVQVAPVDYSGVYGAERQAQAAKKGGITGAIGSIGGAALGGRK